MKLGGLPVWPLFFVMRAFEHVRFPYPARAEFGKDAIVRDGGLMRTEDFPCGGMLLWDSR